jgi:hypothetical protein
MWHCAGVLQDACGHVGLCESVPVHHDGAQPVLHHTAPQGPVCDSVHAGNCCVTVCMLCQSLTFVTFLLSRCYQFEKKGEGQMACATLHETKPGYLQVRAPLQKHPRALLKHHGQAAQHTLVIRLTAMIALPLHAATHAFVSVTWLCQAPAMLSLQARCAEKTLHRAAAWPESCLRF